MIEPLPVAEDLAALGARIDRFLHVSQAPRAIAFRSFLRGDVGRLGPIAVVGGLPRDLARAGEACFRSDVDLAIDAPSAEVDAFARRIGATANRLGGYRLHGEDLDIDFWALRETWAARRGLARVNSFADAARCTFFDCDGIAYAIGTREIHVDAGYLDRLRAGVLDLRLAETPSIDGNVLRAARRMLLWGFSVGPGLRDFLDAHLVETRLPATLAIERRVHGDDVVASIGNASDLRARLALTAVNAP